jgi:hypothetical protein
MISKRFIQGTDWCKKHPEKLYLLVAILIVADHILLGPYSYLKWHDLGDSHFTRYLSLAESFSKFGSYNWYPFAGSGVDNLATGYRFWDVYFISFLFLPDWTVIPLLRIVQIFIAGYFTYRLCRDNLRLSIEASIFGGLFFATLQPNLMEYYFGLGALPFLAWVIEKYCYRPGLLIWLCAPLLGAVYAFFAPGHLTVPYMIPGLWAWLVLVRMLPIGRSTFLIMALSAVCIALQLDLFTAMIVNSPFSHRSAWNINLPYYDRYWSDIVELIIPILPLLCLCFAASALTIKRNVSPAILVGLICIIFSLAYFGITIRRELGPIFPILRGFTIYRVVDTLPFFTCMGAAWGLHELSTHFSSLGFKMPLLKIKANTALYGIAIIFIVYHPASSTAANIRDWVKWGNFTTLYRSPDIEKIAQEYKNSKEPFRVVTVQENGLQAGYANAYGLETADGYLNLYPRRYQRFWDIVVEPFLLRNAKARDYLRHHGNRISLLSDDGHPLHLIAENYFRTHLLSLANVKYFISSVPLLGPGLSLVDSTKPDRFWDELSTREKVQARLSENFSGRRVLIYRNETVRPRWFLADGVTFSNGDHALRNLLAQQPIEELVKKVIVEKKHAASFDTFGPYGSKGIINLNKYSPDKISLKVSNEKDTVLVLTNTFSPFWEVSVDKLPTKVIPAYGTFWSVPLKSGTHVVEFTYVPPYK